VRDEAYYYEQNSMFFKGDYEVGYYFSLEHTNLLSNLIDGNVKELIWRIQKDNSEKDRFVELLSDMGHNLISKNPSEYLRISDMLLTKLNDSDDIRFTKERRSANYAFFLNSVMKSPSTYELIDMLSKALKSFEYKFLILKNRNPDEKLLENIVEKYEYGFSALFLQPQDMGYDNYGVLNAFPHIEMALANMDRWPGVLIWKNNKKAFFIKLKSERSLEFILENLDSFGERALYDMQSEDEDQVVNYIFHFSDLHIGASNIQRKLNRLKKIYRSKLEEIDENAEIDFVITGDSVDSPEEAAIQCLDGFVDDIINDNGKEPHIILGNHDIDDHGFALNENRRRVASNTISISGQKLIVLKNNIILIPFNSNIREKESNGMIGEDQLGLFGNKLDQLEDEKKYTKIALLHHHLAPIPNPTWRREKWYEKLFPSRIERALVLIDSDNFKEWIQKREIKVVLHGHKHIPYYDDQVIPGSIIIACGSSTGNVNHIQRNKTYLSYNLIKITKSNIVVTQYVEELLGSGTKSLLIKSIAK
jgi:predicted phosphodiesterase